MTRAERAAVVLAHAKPGCTLTHTGCGGILQEHIFLGMDGAWMRGNVTRDTRRLVPDAERVNHSIAPGDMTHINRVPIEVLAALDELADQALQDGAP